MCKFLVQVKPWQKWRACGAALATVAVFLLGGTSVIGEGDGASDEVVQVEEDWQLVLNEPNDLIEAPQFHTVMSPLGDINSYYAQVLWNHRELQDSFMPGGLQLQSWRGDDQLNQKSIFGELLSTSAETISWTQILATDGIELAFAIDNGLSQTWGAFGKDIRITQSASVPNLEHYSTSVSVANSWITFGSNRVDSLTITQVRRYGRHGLISVDRVPKVVYQYHDSTASEPDVGPLEDWVDD